MKTERNILIAFVLNLFFSIFELFGGMFTGSVAIISDAIHDVGDAVSIGVSYFLERKSKKQPDISHTYGYMRYSVLGSFITTLILLIGSLAVIYNAGKRLFVPTEINYNGMIVFAVVGVVVNFAAAYITRSGDSVNQKAVNLHMFEDVLGWIAVLIGAVVMRFTDISIIDPIISIVFSSFILVAVIKNLKVILDLFLEKTPKDISVEEIVDCLFDIEGVKGVHHIHVRSIDGQSNYATMHIVTDGDSAEVKKRVREVLRENNIVHATIETETAEENCLEDSCSINFEHTESYRHKHNHSHHHHHH